jgi:phosphopantothenoylcysteine decarboxylase/phosphopantothenate--cysteine ligase
MAEPEEILAAIEALLIPERPLSGLRALVTSGPTLEPIDPVRFLGNRSSGKQGHAIASALDAAGADTVLVSGPTALADPPGVEVRRVETAEEMLSACLDALPVDVAVCAAAVVDWRPVQAQAEKMKKTGGEAPKVELVENPDVLAALAANEQRPKLVIGFAAETRDVVANATEKRERKGCDWIVANDVSSAAGTFGGERNTVHLISGSGVESWPTMDKSEVARRLVSRIGDELTADGPQDPQ